VYAGIFVKKGFLQESDLNAERNDMAMRGIGLIRNCRDCTVVSFFGCSEELILPRDSRVVLSFCSSSPEDRRASGRRSV